MNYAGVDLPVPAQGEIALGAVVLMKVMSADGGVHYREWKSPEIHFVEALGMTETARDTFKQMLMGGIRPHRPT